MSNTTALETGSVTGRRSGYGTQLKRLMKDGGNRSA
jgi:hypothetical protein